MKLKSVEIKKATIKDKPIIVNLMQLYIYDFSEFVEAYVEKDGLFSAYPYLDHYWEEPERIPYLIRMEGKLAGFALIRFRDQEVANAHWSMAEFFIMKKFRRSGLGKAAAQEIFDRHKGNWEVLQIEKNKPAQSFWRKVINEYTDGAYAERIEEGSVIQSFCCK